MVIRYDFVKSMNRSRIPDPPEPVECNGEFSEERCDGCSEYDECAKEDYERQCDVTHILENMV